MKEVTTRFSHRPDARPAPSSVRPLQVQNQKLGSCLKCAHFRPLPTTQILTNACIQFLLDIYFPTVEVS